MINKLKIGLLCVGIFLALLVSELTARIIQPKYAPPVACQKSDEILHHVHIPQAECKSISPLWNVNYKINVLGARDREYAKEKPQNSLRILVLGDSFTEGYGVKQGGAFADQLEILINQNSEKTIEVINAGVASYSPILEYLYLKDEGLSLGPDLVILALDVTDFYDENQYVKTTIHDQQGNPTAVRPFEPNRDYFNYINTIYNAKLNFLTLNSALAKLLLSPKPEDLFITHLFNPDSESVDLVEKHLSLISELLSQNQINFLLVTYPYYEQIKNSEYLKPIEEINKFAKGKNIKFLDLTSSFMVTNPQNLYLLPDIHFSEKGHKLIAQKLAEYLKINPNMLLSVKIN